MSNITGERISYLRCECNLTREELCKIIGVSKRTIVAYEQGTRDPSVKTLRALVEYFNVSADYILYGLDDNCINKTKKLLQEYSENEIIETLNFIKHFIMLIRNI